MITLTGERRTKILQLLFSGNFDAPTWKIKTRPHLLLKNTKTGMFLEWRGKMYGKRERLSYLSIGIVYSMVKESWIGEIHLTQDEEDMLETLHIYLSKKQHFIAEEKKRALLDRVFDTTEEN